MKITLQAFSALPYKAPVVIHSLAEALYQASVIIDDKEHLLVMENGRPLRSHSLERLRAVLQPLPVASLVLRQQSAYDEMVGQPVREGANTLEVPLGLPEQESQTLH